MGLNSALGLPCIQVRLFGPAHTFGFDEPDLNPCFKSKSVNRPKPMFQVESVVPITFCLIFKVYKTFETYILHPINVHTFFRFNNLMAKTKQSQFELHADFNFEGSSVSVGL